MALHISLALFREIQLGSSARVMVEFDQVAANPSCFPNDSMACGVAVSMPFFLRFLSSDEGRHRTHGFTSD